MGRVYLRARSQVTDVQTRMQSFNFFFGLQLGVLVLRHNRQLILYFTMHIAKICFSSLQGIILILFLHKIIYIIDF